MKHVLVVPYNYSWRYWYSAERDAIKSIFAANRLMAIEHFGSTLVQGLCAKPIIDMLVGLNELVLLDDEIDRLGRLGYGFIEKSVYCERFYFKKRGQQCFNLSIVKYSGQTWSDCLVVRDYLRTHPQKAVEYAKIKCAAIAEGRVTISAYSAFKREFIKELYQCAKEWAASSAGNRFIAEDRIAV